MICPGCYKPLKVGPELYSKCDNCGTIAATRSIDDLVETENDKAQERNQFLANVERFYRVQSTLPFKAEVILDYGCGDGSFIRQIKKSTPITALGIDKDNAHFLPHLVPNQLDAVFMVEVIEHLENPRRTLWDLHDLMRERGILYIETTFSDEIEDYKTNAYVNPKIGHRTILSRSALMTMCEGLFDTEEINANVMLLKKI